tara:strand:- start:10639 stop:12060 length:1422 start_codon:yes stop_codon:yes gene_type:complete
MMKKNIINEVTKRILKEKFRTNRLTEAIEYDPQHPERMNPDIEGKLRSGEHIYGKSKSVPSGSENQNYSEKLASKRFKEIINKVKRYHGVESINPRMMAEMFSIMQEVGQIETNHKDALEKLAVDIVSEEFDIPDQMLEANLSPPGTDLNFGGDEEEEDEDSDFDVPKQPKSAERMEELEMEVDKRRILNALMQGASKKGHYIFHMVADELDALNPRLMVLYGKLMSLADFQYWIIPESSMDAGGAGGSEKIEWRKAEEAEDEDEEEEMEKVDIEEGDDIPVVVAKAWIFPLLVHELIKGTLELSAINWADGHLDFEEQTEVIEKADTIEGEIWGMRLGPGMWEKFLDCIDPDDYDIKQWLFHELSKLPAKQFHSFMKEILVGSQKCKEVIKTLKDLHNQEPSEGLDDMIDDTGYDDMGDVLDNLGAEVDDETPQETKDVDYSEMSRKEIEDLINDALDNGDFETVAKLHKYI